MMKVIKNSDSVEKLFELVNFKKSRAYSQRLKSFNIYSVAQLKGALTPNLPVLNRKDASRRGFSNNYSPRGFLESEKNTLKKLRSFLGLSQVEAKNIVRAIKEVREPDSMFLGRGFQFGFGSVRGKNRSSSDFWQNAPAINVTKGVHLISKYSEMGSVFDQGERGTCVANACCSLLDYKSRQSSSRQFLYHQCKMVDGIKNEEGTYISTALKLLQKKEIADFGTVPEKVWQYETVLGSTTHHGPPPENAYQTNRFAAVGQLVSPRRSRLVEDIKYLLNYSSNGKENPVVIGIRLFESFFSYETKRTGWVTLPFPGEMEVGGHAMIVVGYDDHKNCFLVRNSWGKNWAYDNLGGYKGHAWIPYQYLRKYSHYEGTMLNVTEQKVRVPLEKRLSEQHQIIRSKEKRVATINRKKRAAKTKQRKISFMGFMIRVAVILLLFNAYHEVVIDFVQQLLNEEFISLFYTETGSLFSR